MWKMKRSKGGTYRGDRYTHDYLQQGEHTAGTLEWIDGVKLEKYTGDGIIVVQRPKRATLFRKFI